ncbi:MAG: threonine/serine dehydratase [Thermogemmatispora sp.]|uniref:threonine ammonia-lyase n=1 Tax=Thermogemmatispora sp. TaxID=1968838 RepID=UPI00262C54F0|nr:threonine/serine dehydratase [Thermogemmatispora sp.]MBX5457263.1 threonine/serine dehydratase [Thermogemmatispora sp.]
MHSYDLAPELTSAYVEEVWQRLPRYLRPTLLLPVPRLSEALGCQLLLASETFQYTGSFKFRAAYHLLASVPQRQIIAASSGNFGQAVAYAARLLGKAATIVMPSTAARVKIEAVQSYGGRVELTDVRRVSRQERVAQLAREQPEAFIAPAYDDYRVVAGNSTLGQEILRQAEVDVLLVPVGGGGLISGQIIARDLLGRPTRIIGAEPLPGNDAARSLRSGQLLSNEMEPETVADGARTLSLGRLNWEIIRQGVEEIIEVPDEVTLEALRRLFLLANLKVEPTGALALGALLLHPERFRGQRVCCIVSGGNVDPALYAQALSNWP